MDFRRAAHRIARRRLMLAMASVLALPGCSRFVRDPVVIFDTSLEVAGGDATRLSRRLERGVYLLSFRERDIDVRVTLDGGGSDSFLEDQIPRHGITYKVVSLQARGDIHVEIVSRDYRTKRGSVEVQLSRWARAPEDAASDREKGYAAQSRADEYMAAGDLESWPKAVAALREAVGLFAKANDDSARGEASYDLAYVEYGPLDKWAQAVQASHDAILAFDRAGDVIGSKNAATLEAAAQLEVATNLRGAAERDARRHLFASSDRALADAASFFERRGLSVRAQYAVNMRAIRAIYQDEYALSATLLSRSVEMARANKDTQEEIRSLGNLAAVDYLRGNILQSIQEYARLLPLLDREHATYGDAALLGNYAMGLADTGDFQRALPVTLEAISLFSRLGEDSEHGIQLTSLGRLYFRMGDGERALDTMRASLPLHERGGDLQAFANALRVTGSVASSLGLHSAALGYIRKAKHVDPDSVNSTRTDILIAGELRALGKLDEAEATLASAVVSPDVWTRAYAFKERARVRLDRNDMRGAIDELRVVSEMNAQRGMVFDHIDTDTLLSTALLRIGDVGGAMAAADEAIDVVDTLEVRLTDPEWRSNFLSSQYAPFEARIAAEFATGSADRDWKAFRIAEAARARSLADELAVVSHSAADARVSALRTRLTAMQRRLESRLRAKGNEESSNWELRRDIAEARGELDSIRARNITATTRSALPVSLADVRPMLPVGTVVLAYFVGDEKSHAWALTRDGIRTIDLPGRTSLEVAIAAARREERNGVLGPDGRALGRVLLGNLLDGLDGGRLLVVPDGPVNSVAFASLPIGDGGADMVVDRYVVSSAPSLALALHRDNGTRKPNRLVVVISDPVYSREDRRLAAVGGSAAAARSVEAQAEPFRRLLYSANEGRAAARAFPDTDVVELAGFDASVARVRALPSNELKVLHFAGHAVVRPDEPDQSALFLSEYSADGQAVGTSRLTADDISRSGLRADLVVLSGCSTGEGRQLRGEGVLGLSYAFLANHSDSVVASLWPVDDALTARFMEEFYTAYRTSGHASDALRTAQLRTRGTAAAGVWASFVVRSNALP